MDCPWYLGFQATEECLKTCPITDENRDSSICPESTSADDCYLDASMISSTERSQVQQYIKAGIEERKRIRNTSSITLNDGIKVKPKLKISSIIRSL